MAEYPQPPKYIFHEDREAGQLLKRRGQVEMNITADQAKRQGTPVFKRAIIIDSKAGSFITTWVIGALRIVEITVPFIIPPPPEFGPLEGEIITLEEEEIFECPPGFLTYVHNWPTDTAFQTPAKPDPISGNPDISLYDPTGQLLTTVASKWSKGVMLPKPIVGTISYNGGWWHLTNVAGLHGSYKTCDLITWEGNPNSLYDIRTITAEVFTEDNLTEEQEVIVLETVRVDSVQPPLNMIQKPKKQTTNKFWFGGKNYTVNFEAHEYDIMGVCILPGDPSRKEESERDFFYALCMEIDLEAETAGETGFSLFQATGATVGGPADYILRIPVEDLPESPQTAEWELLFTLPYTQFGDEAIIWRSYKSPTTDEGIDYPLPLSCAYIDAFGYAYVHRGYRKQYNGTYGTTGFDYESNRSKRHAQVPMGARFDPQGIDSDDVSYDFIIDTDGVSYVGYAYEYKVLKINLRTGAYTVIYDDADNHVQGSLYWKWNNARDVILPAPPGGDVDELGIDLTARFSNLGRPKMVHFFSGLDKRYDYRLEIDATGNYLSHIQYYSSIAGSKTGLSYGMDMLTTEHTTIDLICFEDDIEIARIRLCECDIANGQINAMTRSIYYHHPKDPDNWWYTERNVDSNLRSRVFSATVETFIGDKDSEGEPLASSTRSWDENNTTIPVAYDGFNRATTTGKELTFPDDPYSGLMYYGVLSPVFLVDSGRPPIDPDVYEHVMYPSWPSVCPIQPSGEINPGGSPQNPPWFWDEVVWPRPLNVRNPIVPISCHPLRFSNLGYDYEEDEERVEHINKYFFVPIYPAVNFFPPNAAPGNSHKWALDGIFAATRFYTRGCSYAMWPRTTHGQAQVFTNDVHEPFMWNPPFVASHHPVKNDKGIVDTNGSVLAHIQKPFVFSPEIKPNASGSSALVSLHPLSMPINGITNYHPTSSKTPGFGAFYTSSFTGFGTSIRRSKELKFYTNTTMTHEGIENILGQREGKDPEDPTYTYIGGIAIT